MSPSRGSGVSAPPPPPNQAPTQKPTSAPPPPSNPTKHNLHFLFSPDSPSSPRPARLRTRALLRPLRYIGIFIFWRIVRYAKYALVGSIVAAVGASAFGGVVSGAAFVLAPPTLLASVGIGAIWALGKWGFRKMRVREMAAVEVKESQQGVKMDEQWRNVQGPRATPL